jgi:single-stranded-DNA-specific exonuclease
LSKFGGHFYAAGLTLPREKLEAFVTDFDREVRERVAEEDFAPSLRVDVESGLDLIEASLLAELQRLEPFGLGNPEPVLLLRGVEVQESRIVGERHLRLRVKAGRHSLGAIGFRLAEKRPALSSRVDLACVPGWNEWNGNKSIQLRMLDLRPAMS